MCRINQSLHLLFSVPGMMPYGEVTVVVWHLHVSQNIKLLSVLKTVVGLAWFISFSCALSVLPTVS